MVFWKRLHEANDKKCVRSEVVVGAKRMWLLCILHSDTSDRSQLHLSMVRSILFTNPLFFVYFKWYNNRICCILCGTVAAAATADTSREIKEKKW